MLKILKILGCESLATRFLYTGYTVFLVFETESISFLHWKMLILQVWSAYKDQKHDLFLPSSAQSAAAGVAGLIESSSSRLTHAITAPPPQPSTSRPPASTIYESNGKQDQL